MPQLSIRIPGSPDQSLHVDRPCTVGPGASDLVVGPAFGNEQLHLRPLAIGLVIESTAPLTIGSRQIAPGTARLLRNGDVARIGEVTILAVGDPPPEGTRELASAMLAGLDPAPADGPSLLIVEGAGVGQRFPMGHVTTVGRGSWADVALADPLVSRRHLRLERTTGEVVAQEVASKNGLLVNGARRRGRRIMLRPGDELQLGSTILVLDEPAAPVPPMEEPGARDPNPEVSLADTYAQRTDPRGGRFGRETIAVVLASVALLGAAFLLFRAAC